MEQRSPWTSMYGLARSLLALSPLLTLLIHDPQILFAPFGVPHAAAADSHLVFRLSLFGLLPFQYIEFARWTAILILTTVLVGWRPRWTGILHWWVLYSFATSSFVLEGGDHIGMLVALLLIPVTLTDDRKWHWSAPPESVSWSKCAIARSCGVAIRIQAAIVYFHAAAAKSSEEDWANGTAVYYWLIDPVFGAPTPLQPILPFLLQHPIIVSSITWGTIMLEALLFCGLLAARRWRVPLFCLGISFHGGIAIFLGLGTFFFPMAALLILYLLWPDRDLLPFQLTKFRNIARMRFPLEGQNSKVSDSY